MKFLNLQNGYSFDALWNEESTRGYIFWFPGEQSTNIIYSMPIALICDSYAGVKISIEENDTFKLIDHTNVETTIDGFIFNEPSYSNEIIIYPEQVVSNNVSHHVAVFNVVCCNKTAGEYICKINIDNEGYIRVGADLYEEHEPVYINLANMGVEIPETIQKAIYTENVHEDFKNNILLNRKFKELISNYWDIVANRGSYKSLINSLKWFEWDELLKIKEIHKQDIGGVTKFSDKDILTIMENNIVDEFTNLAKTTYVSLYCSLYNEVPNTYDIEGNPTLEKVVFNWTENDIKLKIALLAQFFGAFFLPIHMSILHATAESIVFTNTIKTIIGANICRDDEFGDLSSVKCNISSDKKYKLTNVKAQASEDTVFTPKFNEHYTDEPFSFGVDIYPSRDSIKDFKIFADNYYVGPGVIIPIEMVIENQPRFDFIKQTTITYSINSKWNTIVFNDKFKVVNNDFKINFNYLAKEAGEYEMLFSFTTASNKTFTKRIKFIVEDTDDVTINLYKIIAKNDVGGFTYEDFADTRTSEYIFRIQPFDASVSIKDKHHLLYLPYMSNDNELYNCEKCYNGIKLNRTFIVNVKDYNDFDTNVEIQLLRQAMTDYLEFIKYEVDEDGNITDKPTYLVYVSKRFYGELPTENVNLDQYDIIRNDLSFYPQFHELIPLNNGCCKPISENDFTISQYDALCAAVEINVTPTLKDQFRYGHLIDNAEWIFKNVSMDKENYYPTSSRMPFIIGENKKSLKPGYYDIIFNYSLSDGIERTISSNSAFRVKYIK